MDDVLADVTRIARERSGRAPEPLDDPADALIPEDEREVPYDPDADPEEDRAAGDESGGVNDALRGEDASDETPPEPDDDQIPSGEGEGGDEEDSAADIEGEQAGDGGEAEGDSATDDMLLARAASARVDPAAFGDNQEALAQAVATVEARLAQLGALEEQAVAPPRRAEQPQPEPGPVAPAPKPTAPQPETEEAPNWDEVESELGAAATKLLKASHASDAILRAEIAELKLAVKEAQDTSQQELDSSMMEEARRVADFIDDSVTALGPEWEDVFGKGRALDGTMTESTPGFDGRKALVDTMRRLARGYIRDGAEPPGERQLLRSAMQILHGKRLTDLAAQRGRDELAQEITTHNKRGVGRPSGTRKRPATPRDAKLAAAQAFVEARQRAAASLTEA